MLDRCMSLDNKLNIIDIGNISYEEAWRKQREFLDKRIQNSIPDTLLLVEHPPTITFGSGSDEWNKLKVDREELTKYGIDFYGRTDRGGGAAFLGPGQIVGYTIMQWPDLQVFSFMRRLEDVMIRTAMNFGIEVSRVDAMNPTTDKPYRATWFKQNGSYKVLCTKGIGTTRSGTFMYTHHGFALHVNNAHNIPYTKLINPCGFPEDETGPISMQTILGKEVDMQDVKKVLAKKFAEVFDKKEVNYNGL